MTKLRRKLLLSVLTLALTFIALGSTTFAWFTLGSEVTANAFGGAVKSGEGIDVCFVDGYNALANQKTWKNQNWVTSFNIAEKIDLTGLKFKDLTSTDGIAINELAGTNATANTATANTDYVELTMYVRALPGTNKRVGEIRLKNVVGAASPEFEWYPDATITGTSNDFTTANAERWNALNALRASFTAEDKDNNEHTEIIEFALTDTNHGSADATTKGTAYKYAKAKHSDITAKDDNSSLPTGNNVINSLTTDGRKGADGVAADLNLKLNDSNVVEYDSYTDNGKTYYIYKITLRVWMEGWDGDCIDAIFGKSVNFGFILSATFDPAA